MDRGSLRTRASQFAADNRQTRYTPTQYNAALNDSNVQFAMDAKCVFKTTTFTTVADQATYSLPTDFLVDRFLTHKGIKLEPKDRSWFLFYNRGSDTLDDKGTPRFYIVDPEETRKTFRLVPIPQADDAGANLDLDYLQIPAEMTSDTDEPLNGTALLIQYHLAIAQHAAYLLLGGEVQTPEIAAKRSELLTQYHDYVTIAIELYGTTKSAPLRMRGGRFWR
jgi:hypothetical protein